MKIFKHIAAKASEASMLLAKERGPCPDAADQGVMERFSCKMAIAPTASISIICGGTSACIEPSSRARTQKMQVLSGEERRDKTAWQGCCARQEGERYSICHAAQRPAPIRNESAVRSHRVFSEPPILVPPSLPSHLVSPAVATSMNATPETSYASITPLRPVVRWLAGWG